jgi:hypothetical protein
MNLEKRLRLLLHFFLESLAITNLWQKQRILFIVRVVQ